MFFMLRSAACIGAVVCMLPDSGGSTALRDLATGSGRLAMGTAARACIADPACARTGATLATAVLTHGLDPGLLAGVGADPGRAKPLGVGRVKPPAVAATRP